MNYKLYMHIPYVPGYKAPIFDDEEFMQMVCAGGFMNMAKSMVLTEKIINKLMRKENE